MREPNFMVASACSLPLIQIGILILGISLNQDLYRQMTDAVGNNFDGEVFFNVIGSVAAQGCIAFALGTFAYLSAGFSTHVSRWLYFLGGVVGILLFGLLLKNGWSFELNHCTPNDGCDQTSPLKFDFMMCVLLGLPMLWCLGLLSISLFVRELGAKRTTQLERYF